MWLRTDQSGPPLLLYLPLSLGELWTEEKPWIYLCFFFFFFSSLTFPCNHSFFRRSLFFTSWLLLFSRFGISTYMHRLPTMPLRLNDGPLSRC